MIDEIKKEILNFQKKIKTKNNSLELFAWGKSNDNKLQILSVNKSKSHTKIEAVYEGKKYFYFYSFYR